MILFVNCSVATHFWNIEDFKLRNTLDKFIFVLVFTLFIPILFFVLFIFDSRISVFCPTHKGKQFAEHPLSNCKYCYVTTLSLNSHFNKAFNSKIFPYSGYLFIVVYLLIYVSIRSLIIKKRHFLKSFMFVFMYFFSCAVIILGTFITIFSYNEKQINLNLNLKPDVSNNLCDRISNIIKSMENSIINNKFNGILISIFLYIFLIFYSIFFNKIMNYPKLMAILFFLCLFFHLYRILICYIYTAILRTNLVLLPFKKQTIPNDILGTEDNQKVNSLKEKYQKQLKDFTEKLKQFTFNAQLEQCQTFNEQFQLLNEQYQTQLKEFQTQYNKFQLITNIGKNIKKFNSNKKLPFYDKFKNQTNDICQLSLDLKDLNDQLFNENSEIDDKVFQNNILSMTHQLQSEPQKIKENLFQTKIVPSIIKSTQWLQEQSDDIVKLEQEFIQNNITILKEKQSIQDKKKLIQDQNKLIQDQNKLNELLNSTQQLIKKSKKNGNYNRHTDLFIELDFELNTLIMKIK